MYGTVKPSFGTPLRVDHPLSQGLVGCWLLNEGSGTKAHDSAPPTSHGTFTGTLNPPTPAYGWCNGPDGYGLRFESSTARVLISPVLKPSLNVVNQNTFHARIVPALLIGTWQSVITWGESVRCGISNAGGVYYGQWTPGGIQSYIATAKHLTNNILNTITGTYDGTNMWAYLNGEKQPEARTIASPIKNVIGAGLNYGSSVASFVGVLVSAMVWNRALSSQEVAYLTAHPYCMFDEDPILWEYSNGIFVPPQLMMAAE